MKDPLQREETPYEILGVEENAESSKIYQNFKAMVASGGDTGKISDARNILNNSNERAFIDIFLYNEIFLNQMKPSVTSDEKALVSRRYNTAEAWGNIQAKLFPHTASMHCLAVLWYWWAVHCEEEWWAARTRSAFISREGLSPAPARDHLWMNVIGSWAFIIAYGGFWKEWGGNGEGIDTELLVIKLETHFKNLFHNYSERYKGIGDEKTAKIFQDYQLKFITETGTATNLYKYGVKIDRGINKVSICGGRILLTKLGLIEMVLKEVKQNESLAMGLSEFSEAAVLLQKKKYDQVIAAVEQQGDKAEAVRLGAMACLERGRQCFEVGQFAEAFAYWGKGLNFIMKTWDQNIAAIREDLNKTIVNSCRERATSLKDSDPNKAVYILDEGLKLVPDENLKLLLGEILTQQAAIIINDVYEWSQADKKAERPNIIADLENCVASLERALKLGCESAHEYLKISKFFLWQAKEGLLALSPEILKAINEANQAANKGNLEKAINTLQQILAGLKDAAELLVKSRLAYFYNLRAVDSLNLALKKTEEAEKAHQLIIEDSIRAFLNQGSGFPRFINKALEIMVKLSFILIILLIYLWNVNKVLFIAVAITALLTMGFCYIIKLLDINWDKMKIAQARCSIKTCKEEAFYSYGPGAIFSRTLLCYSHSEQLKKIIEGVNLDDATKYIIASAYADILKANTYNPKDDKIKNNLEFIRKLMTRYAVSGG